MDLMEILQKFTVTWIMLHKLDVIVHNCHVTLHFYGVITENESCLQFTELAILLHVSPHSGSL